MKAKRVLEILDVTRKTLNSYVKTGKIKVTDLGNGFYNYDEDDVMRMAKDVIHKRRIIVFDRGSKIEITPDFPEYDKIVEYLFKTVKFKI